MKKDVGERMVKPVVDAPQSGVSLDPLVDRMGPGQCKGRGHGLGQGQGQLSDGIVRERRR